MSTSSITKTFTINSEEAYERFMKALEEPDYEEFHVDSHRIEEGLEKLKQFSLHLKN